MFKIKDLYDLSDCDFNYLFENIEYPWTVLPRIKEHISECVKNENHGYSCMSDMVLIGNNSIIEKNVNIKGPCIIGDNTVIRSGAYIRENVIISNNCVVGNSTELKNCILMSGVQVPHYNYVGDSILGKNVHLGAGVICSNLKFNKQTVCIGEQRIDTSLKKVGAFIGDGADIGSGCVLNPGTVIGKNTVSYPLQSLRGVYPANVIIKDINNIVERRK